MPIEQVTTLNGGRYYEWKGEQFRSVTTILGIINKPGLLPWVAGQVAQKAIDSHTVLGHMINDGDIDDALRLLKSARYTSRDKAADRGTAVHEAAEAIATGAPFSFDDYAEETHGYIRAFQNWCNDKNPEFVAVEVMLASRKGRYAGTVDLRVKSPGGYLATIDIKTSKNIYPDTALQVAAYNNAEFQVVDEQEVPWEPTEFGGILHLKPNGQYVSQPIDVGEEAHHAFLAASELYYWKDENKGFKK